MYGSFVGIFHKIKVLQTKSLWNHNSSHHVSRFMLKAHKIFSLRPACCVANTRANKRHINHNPGISGNGVCELRRDIRRMFVWSSSNIRLPDRYHRSAIAIRQQLKHGLLFQVLLPVPLFLLRLPLPLQRPVQQPGARYIMALYTGKSTWYIIYLSPLRICRLSLVLTTVMTEMS